MKSKCGSRLSWLERRYNFTARVYNRYGLGRYRNPPLWFRLFESFVLFDLPVRCWRKQRRAEN